MLIATGKQAIWQAYDFICTEMAVVFPPMPWGPNPLAFNLCNISVSMLANFGSGFLSFAPSKSASFDSNAAFSNVPPIPTPTNNGGHAFTPFFVTHSTIKFIISFSCGNPPRGRGGRGGRTPPDVCADGQALRPGPRTL